MSKVLVCDDDEVVRRGLERLLVRAGHSVTAAASSDVALASLKEERFDVVLSDIMMPGLTGIDLLREVRKRDLDLPVILVTGLPDVTTAITAVELGAFRYVPKPYEPADLLASVDRAAKMHLLAKAKREALALSGQDEKLLGDRASLETRFDGALARMWMAFQPIVSSSTKAIVAYEALLRTDEATLKNPLAFVTAAERLGRVHELGRAVRAFVAGAAATAPSGVQLFVNLHPSDLLDADLIEGGALRSHASRVVLEITERASLEHIEDVGERVKALRAHGYKIALDDLGAGYAGLTSMTTLAPDVVKLDMTLVRGIDADERRRAVVESLISLCEGLSMRVVLEGVENARERDALVKLGGDVMQGYHFARPSKGFVDVAGATFT